VNIEVILSFDKLVILWRGAGKHVLNIPDLAGSIDSQVTWSLAGSQANYDAPACQTGASWEFGETRLVLSNPQYPKNNLKLRLVDSTDAS